VNTYLYQHVGVCITWLTSLEIYLDNISPTVQLILCYSTQGFSDPHRAQHCICETSSYIVSQCPTEPDYEFDKPLEDTDAFEKETAEFKCEVSDKDARVQWFLEDKVGGTTSPRQTKMTTQNIYLQIAVILNIWLLFMMSSSSPCFLCCLHGHGISTSHVFCAVDQR